MNAAIKESKKEEYKWWDKADNKTPLKQGDIIENYPFLIPPIDILNKKTGEDVRAKLRLYNVIILSQSCDIDACKIDTALVCPVTLLKDFVASMPDFFPVNKPDKLKRALQNLKDDHIIGACLLEECSIPEIKTHPLVVEFKNTQTTPLEFLQAFARKKQGYRLRLLPPYRERLSQSFAKFFMRVGLPIDIDVKKICKEMSSEESSVIK